MATRIALGPKAGGVYNPGYHLKFYQQGDPSRPVVGVDLYSLLSLQTSKNLQDISGTFTMVLKDGNAKHFLKEMDVVRIRLRGHGAPLQTVFLGVVDTVTPSGSAGVDSAQQSVTITGRCAAKYLQVTSLFRPVWDPTTNIPTALTFGQGGATNHQKTPRGIFGYLLRAFTYGKRGMVGESGVPNSRFWLDYKKRFAHINYDIPFMQFDEEDMGSVLKRFEILGFTEAWVDELGHIVYRQPKWDAAASYSLGMGNLRDWSFSRSDVDCKTYVEVVPVGNPGISSALAQALLTGRAPVPSSYLHAAAAAASGQLAADPDFIIHTSTSGKVTKTGLKNYWYRRQLTLGVRPMQVSSPLLFTQAQAQAQAEGLLRFYSRMAKTATLTLPGDPRVKLGTSIYVYGHLDGELIRRTFYIEGVQHDYVEGSHYDTTLTLTHGKDPWDPKWGTIALPSTSLADLAQSGGVSPAGAGTDFSPSDPSPLSGVTGKSIPPVIDASGMNPGTSLKPVLIDFLSLVGGAVDKALIVTTGTHHSINTINGSVSQHSTGNAADMGVARNGQTQDDSICFAALRLCGLSVDDAGRLAHGGIGQAGVSLSWNGHHVQVFWKSNDPGIGNHFDHVHIGVA